MLVNHNDVLVTGGAGFIGSHLVQALIGQESIERVVVFDNLSTGQINNIPTHSKIQFIKGDLCEDESGLLEITKNIDTIFHLAAQTSVQRSIENPEFDFTVNATGTLKLLKAACSNQAKRVVLASTCAVYGEQGSVAITEQHAVKPISPYASSKAASEAIVESFFHSYGIESVIVRMFNVYGYGQNPNSTYANVLTKFLTQAMTASPCTIYGTGQQTRDYLHVSDAVVALCKAGLNYHDVKQANIFNIGSGQSTSILELVEIIGSIIGRRPELDMRPARTGEIIYSQACIDLAYRLLDFTPQTSLPDGISQVWKMLSSGIKNNKDLRNTFIASDGSPVRL